MKVFVVLLGVIALTYADTQCTGYEHEDYGCVGQCISTSSCPGSKYQSNLCPSYGVDIKCCFTADTDDECAEYNHPTHGQVGSCISTDQCPYNNYISNLCPTKAAGVKCCFSKPTDTCSSGGSECSSAAECACKVRDHPSIFLLTVNPSGVNDGADAYSNIVDTCNGGLAKRSSYCSSGPNGGYISLKTSVLKYILAVADSGQFSGKLQVNSIAGACHSATSWHYQGTAVDFQVKSGDSYTSWMNMCWSHGARESLGPGDAGHSSHTHCAFSS